LTKNHRGPVDRGSIRSNIKKFGRHSKIRTAIRFRVSRAWIRENRIDEQTIRLYRLEDNWQPLPTQRIGADQTYLYFEAETPWFPWFAVAGDRLVVPPPAPIAPPPAELPLFLVILLAAAVIAGFAVVYRLLTRPHNTPPRR
jgi:hypothetical protein